VVISLESIKLGIGGLLDEGQELLGDARAAALGGAVAGSVVTGAAILGAGALAKSNGSFGAKRRKKTRITHTKRGWKQDRARRSKQKWEIAYQRRKHKSKRKGVHYTKNGQPYIILSSGKAKFIKKRR